MKKLMRFVPLALMLVAQLSTSQTLRVGIGVGGAVLKSHTIYTATNSDRGYGFGPVEPSFQGVAKVALSFQRMNVVARFSFVPLRGNGSSDWVSYAVAFPFESMPHTDTHADLTNASIGVEWFIFKESSGPHLGLRALLSLLSNVRSESRVVQTTVLRQTFDGWTQFGFGITGGVEIPVYSSIAIDLGGHYNFDWLFGGRDGEPGLDAYGLEASVLVTVL